MLSSPAYNFVGGCYYNDRDVEVTVSHICYIPFYLPRKKKPCKDDAKYETPSSIYEQDA
jgi:hypothetical protein